MNYKIEWGWCGQKRKRDLPILPFLLTCLVFLLPIPESLGTLENTVLMEQGLCHLGNYSSDCSFYPSHDLSSHEKKNKDDEKEKQ